MEIQEENNSDIENGENKTYPISTASPEECINMYFINISQKTKKRECKLALPNARYAEICMKTVSVDKELSANLVHREITVDNENLILYFFYIEHSKKKI